MKDTIQRFLAIEDLIKELNEEKKELSEQIIESMEQQGANETPKIDGAVIKRLERKTWKFSDTVANMEQDLKDHKADEKQTGLADYETSTYLRVYRD